MDIEKLYDLVTDELTFTPADPEKVKKKLPNLVQKAESLTNATFYDRATDDYWTPYGVIEWIAEIMNKKHYDQENDSAYLSSLKTGSVTWNFNDAEAAQAADTHLAPYKRVRF